MCYNSFVKKECVSMIQANYHSHLVYCNHAKGHAEDYIKVALENGFKELGISDHAPLLPCFMSSSEFERFGRYYRTMTLDTALSKYLPEVEEAKKKYAGKIKILSAFEIEYFSTSDFFVRYLRKRVDYLNLGIHMFEYKDQILNSYYQIDSETIYAYMKAAIDGMKTGLFNTLVHPDLFMYAYKDENMERKFDEHCQYVSRKIIETAIECNVYLELNANGIYNSRNSIEWLYPCKEFWEIAKEYPKLKIIIGADAHEPKALACDYIRQAEDFASELGLKIDATMEVNH